MGKNIQINFISSPIKYCLNIGVKSRITFDGKKDKIKETKSPTCKMLKIKTSYHCPLSLLCNLNDKPMPDRGSKNNKAKKMAIKKNIS